MRSPAPELILLFLLPLSALSDTTAASPGPHPVTCPGPKHITPAYGFGVREDRGNEIPPNGVGATFSFFCLSHFDLDPPDEARRTCQEDGAWSGSSLTCVPKSGTVCEEPSLPEHVVSLTPAPDSYPMFQVLVLGCEEGWVGRGNLTAQCNHFKRWVIDFECRPGCPEPTLPEHSFVKYKDIAVDESVTARCSEGYKLLGVPEIRCEPDKTWTIQFGCCSESSSDEGRRDAQTLYKSHPEYFYGPILAVLVLLNVILGARLLHLRKSKNKIISTDMIKVKPAKNLKTDLGETETISKVREMQLKVQMRSVAVRNCHALNPQATVTAPYRKLSREFSF